MLFPFTLPTTSTISYPTHFESSTYPSLPILTSSHRGVLRNALKSHKRLAPSAQDANIPSIIKHLELYIAHLLALFAALTADEAIPRPASPPFSTSWRAVLSAKRLTASESPRVLRPGLSYEIFWSLSTLAYAYYLLARWQVRQALFPPSSGSPPPPTSAANLFNQCSANLLTSASIFTHLLSRARPPHASSWPADLSPQVLSALSSLSLSAATLVAVVKQDSYPTYLSLATTSDKKRKGGSGDRDWLYNPPDPPSGVKALLLARLCIAASDHASKALGILSTFPTTSSSSTTTTGVTGLSDDIAKYADGLRRVSKAKACRFLGIDAEAQGRVGEGIGWIAAARDVLGSGPRGGVGFKMEGAREKDGTWGLDAGRAGEGLTLDALDGRWRKLNDGVMFQRCPEAAELVARIPSGREIHSVREWAAPEVGGEELRLLRVGGEGGALGVEVFVGEEEDSGGEEVGNSRIEGSEYAGKGGYY